MITEPLTWASSPRMPKTGTPAFPRSQRLGFLHAQEALMDMDALVTGAQASAKTGVSRAAICQWRKWGRLKVRGWHGRSPLYRWGDVLDVERDTRQSGRSPRNRARLTA